eukprot:gene16530-22757_t
MSGVSKLSELPDDVISDIVLRALRLEPSIGDLSVVCKQWRGLISQNLVQVLIDRGKGDIPPLVERALSHGQFITARGLAERIDSLEQNARLLRSVSATGHVDIAGLLLSRRHHAAPADEALVGAVRGGHVEVGIVSQE